MARTFSGGRWSGAFRGPSGRGRTSLGYSRTIGGRRSKVSTRSRIMDILRRKGQNPYISASGGISTSARGGAGVSGGGNRLAKIIYDKNLAAEKEMKARDAEQAALNKQAYESGMMPNEEYQALESKGFEATRAQFGNVGREFGETAYNRLNTGALRAGARDIKMREAEAIGSGVRELGLARLRRKSEASRIYAGAEQTRQSQFQQPRYKIPETMGMGDRATAISGPEPVSSTPAPVRRTSGMWSLRLGRFT